MKQSFITKIFALTLALSLTFSAGAQFLGPHLLPPGSGLEQQLSFYHYADLDADGHEDLLTVKVTRKPGTAVLFFAVDWHRNDGAGGYELPSAISSVTEAYFFVYPHYVQEIKTADLDGNGLEDVIYRRDNDIAWQANYGGGNFGPMTIPIPTNSFVELGDLDNDGDLDIVTNTDTGVEWSANDGAGNFQNAGVIFPQICCHANVRLAELNGDGRLDVLAFGIEPNWLRWYPNLGGGAFGAAASIASNIFTNSNTDFECADVDGDGDTDVIGAFDASSPDLSDANLLWWPNDGAGGFPGFTPVFTIPPSETPFNPNITVTDVNDDNAPDILGLGAIYCAVWTNQNNGAGDFIQSKIGLATLPSTLQATDLDADGFSDISLQFGSSVYMLRSDGNGTFESLWRVHQTLHDVQGIQMSDLNGDASPDLIYTQKGGGDGVMGWHANDGTGQFGGFQQVTTDLDMPLAPLIGDLDGDGDKDILFRREFDSDVYQRRNDGAGNFGPETFASYSSEAIFLLDRDNDQDLDILSWNYSNPQLSSWQINDGTGNFPTYSLVGDAVQDYYLLDFGDIDSDGDLDMLQLHYADGQIYWFLNGGNGAFVSKIMIGYDFGNFSHITVKATDLDGDGDLDVLATDQNNGIRWWVNQEDNGFMFDPEPRIIDPNTKGAVRAVVADFDQDGDNDIVTAFVVDSLSNAPGQFAWYENLGGAEFATPRYFGESADCKGLQAADFDGDGDLELIWHSSYAIGWWDNLGNEPFISGICFWDKNENKIRDSGEPPAAGIQLNLQPASLRTFVASNGAFKFFVSSGHYTLSYDASPCWELTTDSSEYYVAYADTTLSGYQFGFNPGNNDRYVQPIVTSGQTRCDSDAPFWISLANRSCNEAAGRVALVLDNLVTFVSSVPAPAMVSGDTLWWNYDTIQPFALEKIRLVLKINGTVGDIIHLQAFTWLDEQDGIFTFSDATVYRTEIRCSFDPNDKMVDRPTVPKDYSPEGYELIYTIRFQNTGNDTAFLVRLRDTLSSSLDWTTLRPLGSSHPYYTVLNTQTGLLQFTLEDIILPDSAANYAGSQGFVQFAIQLQPGLPPGTVVPNSAGIYFDANPVVLTNMAETQVLTPLSTHLPVAPPFLLVQPNPTTGICTLRLAQPANEGALLEVLDAQGRLLRSLVIPTDTLEQTLDMEDLSAGLYLIKLAQVGHSFATTRLVKQ